MPELSWLPVPAPKEKKLIRYPIPPGWKAEAKRRMELQGKSLAAVARAGGVSAPSMHEILNGEIGHTHVLHKVSRFLEIPGGLPVDEERVLAVLHALTEHDRESWIDIGERMARIPRPGVENAPIAAAMPATAEQAAPRSKAQIAKIKAGVETAKAKRHRRVVSELGGGQKPEDEVGNRGRNPQPS